MFKALGMQKFSVRFWWLLDDDSLIWAWLMAMWLHKSILSKYVTLRLGKLKLKLKCSVLCGLLGFILFKTHETHNSSIILFYFSIVFEVRVCGYHEHCISTISITSIMDMCIMLGYAKTKHLKYLISLFYFFMTFAIP